MPTSRRIYRIAKAIHNRQCDLIFALDGVHDQHNLSAVLRTADATGVGHVIWFPDICKPKTVNPEVSKGSEKWVKLEIVDNLTKRLSELKKQGFKIAATHMGSRAVDFRSIDWTTSWVVVMGNEQSGCSDDILEVADENIALPMLGLVQSLNVSVAAAVIMYEIQRQRENAGMYSRTMPPGHVELLFKQWQLEPQGYKLHMMLRRPEGELPALEFEHQDGRAIRKFPKVMPQ